MLTLNAKLEQRVAFARPPRSAGQACYLKDAHNSAGQSLGTAKKYILAQPPTKNSNPNIKAVGPSYVLPRPPRPVTTIFLRTIPTRPYPASPRPTTNEKTGGQRESNSRQTPAVTQRAMMRPVFLSVIRGLNTDSPGQRLSDPVFL